MDLNTIETVVAADRFSACDWRAGDAWLAGGTWLFSEPQPGITRLVDLRALNWPPLTVRGEGCEIAATCTLAQLHAFRPPAPWPAAAQLIPACCNALLGSWKVWHEATVGGNLCLSLPAGSMTSLVTALDGVCTIWSPDGTVRRLPATEFVTGAGTNALAPGELLRSVTLPDRALRSRAALARLSLSPRGRSAVVVAGRRDPGGETVITVTAAVTRPLQLRFPTLPSVAGLTAAIADAQPAYHDDVHGDPRWRERLTAHLAEQVRAQLAG